MGWGKIIFGHTFPSTDRLYKTVVDERDGKRDITLYLRDPHVLLSKGPDQLFLDPSHTYRLWMHDYRPPSRRMPSISVRRISSRDDAEAINHIYRTRKMVTCDPDFIMDRHASRSVVYLVAEHLPDSRIVGTVTGVDHVNVFNDPEKGASLWCLAVDPQSDVPGIGELLVRHLVEYFHTRGRSYIDLSVMHDNSEAIALYEKLGFQRVPVFCVKRKNSINEQLFISSFPEQDLNPYSKIIIEEAQRRGISVKVLDADFNYFTLGIGGRTVVCRESLTELTSAIAMSRCDDKRLTHRVLKSAGLNVPKQFEAQEPTDNDKVLGIMKKVVVKPARGEQGNGVSVGVKTPERLENAVRNARKYCPDVIIEEFVEGEDLRIIVIDYNVVAAAVRRPPEVAGTGQQTVKDIVEKYNRRRAAATGGESHVPMDDETMRCIRSAGYDLDAIPPVGERIQLRKAANLHTGGTIHDVTDRLHPDLSVAAENAALALDIPVTGLDFLVPDVAGPDYVIVEANERPGLANHEPRPTAERFIDLLFPQTSSPTETKTVAK
jgi:GNAT-family acetyltransferase (TIGR03103 family)